MAEETLELEARLIERVVERREAILRKAEEEAERILREAEEEARRIREEAEREILNLLSSDLKALRDRIVGAGELEGRRLLMEAREKAVSTVFQEVERRMREIAEGRDESVDYDAVLSHLILEGVEAIGGGDIIIQANERDLERIRRMLKEVRREAERRVEEVNLKLDGKPIEAMGGVILRSVDGSKIYYNTLEGRLARVRRRMEGRVAEVLGVI